MARFYITEYIDQDASQEPPLAEHVLDVGLESVASEPFDTRTRSVRFHSDAPCSIVFGTDPVATRDNQRLAKNVTDTKQVPAGQGFKIAVIANESSTAEDTSAVLEIVKLITDPKAARKAIEELTELRTDVSAQQSDLSAKLKKFTKDQADAEKAHSSKDAELAKREAALAAKATDSTKRESDLATREAAIAATEKTHATRSAALDAREKALHSSETRHQAELKTLADRKAALERLQAAQATRESRLAEILRSS